MIMKHVFTNIPICFYKIEATLWFESENLEKERNTLSNKETKTRWQSVFCIVAEISSDSSVSQIIRMESNISSLCNILPKQFHGLSTVLSKKENII